MNERSQENRDGAIRAMLTRRPDLEACVPELLSLTDALVGVYENGGTLFTFGNGGSQADAMHIAGELCKSFTRGRPLSSEMIEALRAQPRGDDLARHLEVGLPAVTLGLNASLKTAVENDVALPHIAIAQEAHALMRPGDMLLTLSTSGNAVNALMALSVAKALGATTAALTGPGGGEMAELADIAIRTPGANTPIVQEAHVVLYHTLCILVEARFFKDLR